MDPSQKTFTNLLHQGSTYSEGSGQSSPPTPQSQYTFSSGNFLQNFHPFGPPGNYPPYGHSPPGYQGVQHQGSWMRPPQVSFHGVQPPESFAPSTNLHFGAGGNVSPSMLHFGPSGGAAANSSSQGSESSYPCPARQSEKQPVNILESNDSSEEEPKRCTRINWTVDENERLLGVWLHHSQNSLQGVDKKAVYYWNDVATHFNDNAPKNAPKRTVKQLKTHWGDVKREVTKFCGVAWKGQFVRGDYKVPTIMLEAVASYDIWIWHAFFGVAGSNNDINVLDQSSLFIEQLQGRAPPVQFTVNGRQYNMGYYLADGIYPEWATFVKAINKPLSEKHKKYTEHQEGARKDVERAFGVLQKCWDIIRHPARLWNRDELADIIYGCIILHNMIVDDERDIYVIPDDNTYHQGQHSPQLTGLEHGPVYGFTDVLDKDMEIRDSATHRRLKEDLVEHIWEKFGPHRQQQE